MPPIYLATSNLLNENKLSSKNLQNVLRDGLSAIEGTLNCKHAAESKWSEVFLKLKRTLDI